MNQVELFQRKVSEVTAFCLARKGRCWPGWSDAKAFQYLAFHALSGTIVVTRKAGEIVGVGVAWPITVGELFRRQRLRLLQFDWSKLPEPGNALLIGDVFAASRAACAKLFQLAMRRWPFVRRLFTFRRGRLVEIHLRTIERLSHGVCA